MNLQVLSQRSYVLKIQPVDKMPDFLQNTFNPDTLFAGQTECQIYVSNFWPRCRQKGYITASVDSVMYDLSLPKWSYSWVSFINGVR